MLTNEIHPGNGGLDIGSDTSTGLTGGMFTFNRDFGQPISKAPSALASIPAHFLESANGFDIGADRDGNLNADRTFIRSDASIVMYTDEFKGGISPIDFATQQIDKMFDVTESWTDGADNETYFDNFLPSVQPDNSSRLDRSFVGAIDTGFQAEDHGTQVVNAIEQVGNQSPDWVADGVGSGTWSESLVKFVDAAKASGHSNAVINLSFDLTQINQDFSISTRFELTTAERAALKYAQVNGVLAVVSAGNQGGAMSALGRASQEFDNVIAVGATEGEQRTDYSSYGAGLDFVASDGGQGTSLAAAEVTGSIARIWDANPQLDYRQVTQTLEATATDLQQPGWDAETGFGRLNLSAAIELAQSLSSQPQESWNSLVLQNLSEKNQANQDILTGLVWEQSNDVISSERPNATPYPGYDLKFSSSAPEYTENTEVVERWQRRMIVLGYDLDVNGKYDSLSKKVARQFQENNKLTVDGVVGPKTWETSFKVNAIKSTPPSRIGTSGIKEYESLYASEFKKEVGAVGGAEAEVTWKKTAVTMLKENKDILIKAAERYGIDGRAIAGVIRWEYEENKGSRESDKWVYDRVQNEGIFLDQSGTGWGKMHYGTAKKVLGAPEIEVPDKRNLAKMLALPSSAIDLIARSMRQAVDAYWDIQKEDISNKPEILANLYNDSGYKEKYRDKAEKTKGGDPPKAGNRMGLWVEEHLDSLLAYETDGRKLM